MNMSTIANFPRLLMLLSYISGLALIGLSTATPLGPIAGTTLFGHSGSIYQDAGGNLTLTANATHSLGDDIRRIIYHVPNTRTHLDLLVDHDLPIKRAALGRTILNGKQRLRNHIALHGDGLLLPDDDPWQIDDKRTGLCLIGVASYAPPPGQHQEESRMLTYGIALDALEGLWDVLYWVRREYSALFTIHVGGRNVGHGKVVEGMT